MDKIVFVCEDNIDSILTSIYTAFEYCKSGCMLDNIGILISSDNVYETELFATYKNVVTDFDKSYKTMEYIKKKLGLYIYTDVLRCLCHYDSTRAYTLFRYLHYCFKYGITAADDLTNEYVLKVMELSRKVRNESHMFLGITRFNSINGVLYASIEPKCNVIPLIINHFSDRFFIENWIIEDKSRKIYAIHKANSETMLYHGDLDMINAEITQLSNYDKYETLWRTFFDSIAIKERENKRCQRNLLPLWMRTNMNEFTS